MLDLLDKIQSCSSDNDTDKHRSMEHDKVEDSLDILAVMAKRSMVGWALVHHQESILHEAYHFPSLPLF